MRCDLTAWILSQGGYLINTVHCTHVCNTQQTPTTNFTPHRADGIDETCLTTRYGRHFDSSCVTTSLGHRYFLRSSVLAAHEPLTAAEPMTFRPATLLLPHQHSLPAMTLPQHTIRPLRTLVILVYHSSVVVAAQKSLVRESALDSSQPFSVFQPVGTVVFSRIITRA